MRIISGTLKGKTISFLKSSITRPLKDSVKENIFNIIIHSNLLNVNIKNSNILDLYSGIGSFGLECISRGAEKITFVEKDKNAAEILQKNLINLGIKKNATVVIDKIDNYIRPISDLRGTSAYRKESLKGLFKRLKKCLEDNVKNMSVMEF